MYEQILVPTDGSDTAEAAVSHAADLASKYGATIHALYVIDIETTDVTLGTEQVERLKRGNLDEMPELQTRAEDATGYVADVAADYGVEVEQHVEIGYPARSIRGFVEDHDVDLVVMGSHGRSGLTKVILGSVSETVLRQTRVPVLVVDVRGEGD